MRTQKEVIEFLKEFWKVKSFDFEAQYNINPKSGKANFWDIKNPKTKENLLHPESQQHLKVRAPDGFDFEIGKYYKIRLFVPNDTIREKFNNEYLLFVDTKNSVPQEIKLSPYEFVKQINNEYNSAIGIAKDTLAGAVKRISYDINRKPETFIFELLQNADDYPDSNKERVNVRFVIKNNLLIVSHNGLPFSPANVRAICSVDAGNKQFDINKTGYKGIGFKSIFKFSNYVIVNSGGYTFRFDEFYHKKRGNETFWQLIPIWTNPQELPEVYNQPQFTSPNVSFCIRPSKSSVTLEDIQSVFKDIFRDERVLLFLRHVTSIDFSGLNDEKFTHAVSKSKWEVSDFLEVEVDEKITEIINRQIKEQDGRVPDKFQDIQTSTIRFATSISDGEIIPSEDTRVFAYLPTDVNLGLPFLINGDFIPDGSRQSIHMDLEWNQYLFEEAGKQFVLWIEKLSSKYLNPDFLKLIPSFESLIANSPERDKKLFLEKFKSGFEHMLSEVAFLPDLDGNPQKIQDLTVDNSGLLSLLGENDFRKYLSIEGSILAPSFVNSQEIKILLDHYEFGAVLNHDSISLLLKNEEFEKYLLDPQKNLDFISFLHERGILADYSDQAIFLSKKGKLKSEDGVYFNLGEDSTLLDWLDIPVLNEKLNQLEFLKTFAKKYSPIPFIKQEILKSATAKASANVFENNQKLYRLLFKHQEGLEESDFFGKDQFREFPVFDRNQTLVQNFNSNTFFITNPNINSFVDQKAIPASLLTIIDPLLYFTDQESTESFWKKLGLNIWSDEILLRLANYFFNNSHLIQMFYEESQTDKDCLAGNKLLWQFIFKTQTKESGENEKSYKEKASKLPVFTSNEEIKPLNNCYLSFDYTGTNSLETLLENHPEIDISFVSKEYIQDDKASDWVKVFRIFGVKTDAKDFIGQYILPEIESVSEEDLVSYTQLIFQNRVHFKEEVAKIKIKVKTEEGEFVEPEEAIIGSYYSKESQDNNVLISIDIQNLISSEYGNHSLTQWTEFFESLGAKVLRTKEEAIQGKLDDYLYSEVEKNSTWEDHQIIFKELLNLHNEKVLTKDHYSSLRLMSLFTKAEGEKSVAYKLFFPSVYNPKIDFEKIINFESLQNRFVSPKYIEIIPEIKSFFKEIGVFQTFRINKREKVKRAKVNHDYLNYLEIKFSYIKTNAQQGYGEQHRIEPYIELDLLEFFGNHEFNKYFWKYFLKDGGLQNSVFTKIKYHCYNPFFESENLILWTIQRQNSIPCQDGESRKPSEVYSYKLNGLLNDKSLLPLIDLSSIMIQGESAEKLLGFKLELDLLACLSILKEKPSIYSLKKSGVWQAFLKIVESSQLNPKELEAFNQFRETGLLPNQLGEWRLITELYYVDQSIDIGITKAPSLIHDELKKVAPKFNITPLNSEDFKPQFKYPVSENFKSLLLSRLKFIALLESPEELDNKILEHTDLLTPLNFFRTSKIELKCDKTEPPIVNSEKQFLLLNSTVHYLRSWQSVNAAELFEYLRKLLDLKKVNTKTLIDLLIFSEEEIIDLLDEKNINYPNKWKKENLEVEEDINESPVQEIPESESNEEISDRNSESGYTQESTNTNHNSSSNREESNNSQPGKEKSEISYSQEEEDALKRVFGNNAPKDFRKDLNLAALIKGLSYLYNQGYDIREAEENLIESHQYSQLYPVIKNGVSYTIKCRSAKTGLLYLRASTWKELENPNTFLYIWTGASFLDAKFCKSRDEVVQDLKADYQVVRLESKPSTSTLDNFLDGNLDPDDIWLIIRTKFKDEYRGIFEDIRKKSKSDSLEILSLGNEDED